jgi:hypothetical protein
MAKLLEVIRAERVQENNATEGRRQRSQPRGGCTVAALTSHLEKAGSLVIKIGSAMLVNPDGSLRQGWLDALAHDIPKPANAAARSPLYRQAQSRLAAAGSALPRVR